jgi:hypothetical protein
VDRVLRVLVVIFVLVCAVTVGLFAFNAYVDSRYADTLTATYLYQVSVATDGPLTDLLLFLPLPARGGGSSEVVRAVGAQGWTEVPEGWNLTLTGTEKYTLLKISAPSLNLTDECGACGRSGAPHILTIPVKVRGPIDPWDPVGNDEALDPRRSVTNVTCTEAYASGDSTPHCTAYETRFFADYTAYPATTVVITVELTGTNRWNIFSERFSEFRDKARLTILGESHGWQIARGELVSGIGYSSLW